MISLKVKGIDKVVKNLARVSRDIGKGTERGLLMAGEFLMRESLKIVPVQIGHLKGSYAVQKKGSGTKAVVTIGYSGQKAKDSQHKSEMYFVYVHEIPPPKVTHGKAFNVKHAAEIVAAKGTWRGTAEGGMFLRGPEQQHKYLERPLKDNADEVLRIVATEIRKS